MIIEGTITRSIDNRCGEIPFYIDTHTGTYTQWGHDTMTLGGKRRAARSAQRRRLRHRLTHTHPARPARYHRRWPGLTKSHGTPRPTVHHTTPVGRGPLFSSG